MAIDRANMRIRVSIPSKNAKNVHDRLKSLFTSIEVEDWEKGDLAIVYYLLKICFHILF